MKKLLVVLLSLGLIAAFAMTASAADVKFSGQYYVTGQYENNRTFQDPDNQSLANFWTRTRVKAVFQVAEGLSLTTRIDALEKPWNGNSNSRAENGTQRLQENIEFEQGYVTFNTMAGTFDIGYQDAGVWGTGFGDTPRSSARIKLTKAFGPFSLLAIYEKTTENNIGATPWEADADADLYYLAGIYKFKAGNAGLLFTMQNDATNRPVAGSLYRTKGYAVTPYMKGTFGPVYVEAEFEYLFGKTEEYDAGTPADVKKSGLGAYALAKMNFGPAYAGLSFGYSSGDDPDTADKDESGTISSTGWSPGIIFGDGNYRTWMGARNPGGANAGTGYATMSKQNLWAYNVFGGYNPTPKLNLDAQFWYLRADKAPKIAGVEFVSKNYGMEFDVTATYKIYDNLSYMVGAGYFWTGDYFKGTNTANKVGNDYVLLNKLTLNF